MVQQDFFRDTWVRYLGYANEVGESFRGVVPRAVVNASYKVAFTYVVADTVTKSWKALRKEGQPTKALIAGGDSFIWQTLASVVIPGLTINRICAASKVLIAKHGKQIPPHLRPGVTVAIGLISIPIIVGPIDLGTTMLMNCTYRLIFGRTY